MSKLIKGLIFTAISAISISAFAEAQQVTIPDMEGPASDNATAKVAPTNKPRKAPIKPGTAPDQANPADIPAPQGGNPQNPQGMTPQNNNPQMQPPGGMTPPQNPPQGMPQHSSNKTTIKYNKELSDKIAAAIEQSKKNNKGFQQNVLSNNYMSNVG